MNECLSAPAAHASQSAPDILAADFSRLEAFTLYLQPRHSSTRDFGIHLLYSADVWIQLLLISHFVLTHAGPRSGRTPAGQWYGMQAI